MGTTVLMTRVQVETLLVDDAQLPADGRPTTLTFHRNVQVHAPVAGER